MSRPVFLQWLYAAVYKCTRRYTHLVRVLDNDTTYAPASTHSAACHAYLEDTLVPVPDLARWQGLLCSLPCTDTYEITRGRLLLKK